MNSNEAIERGIELHETKHSMKRRTTWHDYYRKGTYMVTLAVEGRMPLFGRLRGVAEAPPGSPDAPHIELSELGTTILRDEIGKINRFYPQVEVWKVCIMPDHIHMIIRVKEDLPEKKHLGLVLRGFKTGCSRAWWRLNPVPASLPASLPSSLPSGKAEGTVASTAVGGAAPGARGAAPGVRGAALGARAAALGARAAAPAASTAPRAAALAASTAPSTAAPAASMASVGRATVPSASPEGLRPVLFEQGYNDKILLHEGQLDNWKAYLDDNPRRLLLKRQNPHLFTVLHGMEVAGHQCQIVGNRFLLGIPDKMAVIVHRRYTDAENACLREQWLACGERGGVLVSAAIAPKEKEVLREAMNRGYRIILLRENGFPKLYKPSGEAFDACSQGLLLQISPWEYHMERKTITRAQCLELNAMAERIVKGE